MMSTKAIDSIIMNNRNLNKSCLPMFSTFYSSLPISLSLSLSVYLSLSFLCLSVSHLYSSAYILQNIKQICDAALTSKKYYSILKIDMLLIHTYNILYALCSIYIYTTSFWKAKEQEIFYLRYYKTQKNNCRAKWSRA